MQSSYIHPTKYKSKQLLNTSEKKHDCLTLAICNSGLSSDIKVITLNKLYGSRTMNRSKIPHYAYT